MEKIKKRLDTLILECNNMYEFFQYQRVVFEIDELIISLIGKNNDIYNNFTIIYQSKKLSAYERGKLLVGVLSGLKSYLHICEQEKKYQIFVSSTYLDLISYRKSIADEIAFKGHIPVGMEDFTACGEDLETYIKKLIDQSDYYILLIGQRFGSSIPSDDNTSYTMMEYYYAKSKDMRILPFIYNGTELLSNNDLETNKSKLELFISEVKKMVPQYFKNEIELNKKLSKALDNEFKNHPQKGWIRF